MGQPAAREGDLVNALDTHVVLVPNGAPVALPHPFQGHLNGRLSPDVNIMGRAAATVDSTADNSPPHLPTAPGTAFQRPPTNRATVRLGSATVRINGKGAARHGDRAETCNDPVDALIGTVAAASTVFIG